MTTPIQYARPQITLEQATGQRLIKSTWGFLGEATVLMFETGFVLLRVKSGYDGDSEVVEDTDFKPGDYCNTLIEAGIITKEQWATYERERNEDWVKSREQSERSEYARLRKKYERK